MFSCSFSGECRTLALWQQPQSHQTDSSNLEDVCVSFVFLSFFVFLVCSDDDHVTGICHTIGWLIGSFGLCEDHR